MTTSKATTYTVRIDYDCGMERIDLTAKDTVDLLVHLARIIRMKQKNTGIARAIKAVVIEHE